VLGKYLVSSAKAQDTRHGDGENIGSSARVSRRRLHLLYLLNDLLHHTKYHTPSSSQFPTFSSSIQPFLADLIELASFENRPRTRVRIEDLLKLWAEEGYFRTDYVDKLREAARNNTSASVKGLPLERSGSTNRTSDSKEQPYVMPASHGDPSTPYHDLPAGNMMPHIMPNRSVPIRPQEIRALQFAAGPADESLVVAVKDFMTAVAEIDSGGMDVREDEGIIEDIDELGQHSIRDETGELVSGRTYYGWSHDFCDKMKSRGQRKDIRSGRERSYSSSRSRSRSPRKRRRYTNSPSSRSTSYSRSRSRDRGSHKFRNGGLEYSRSDRGRREMRSSSRSPSYSPSFQPAPTRSDPELPAGNAPLNHMSSQDPRRQGYPIPQNIPPPPSISPPGTAFNPHAFPPPPMGPGGLPIPPPPPPNYSGPWPPPPPPLGPNMAFNSTPGTQSYQSPQGFSRPPPPQQGGQQHYGGSGSGRWHR
jgi:CID domain